MRQDEPTRGQPQTISQRGNAPRETANIERPADLDQRLAEELPAPREARAPSLTWQEIKGRFVDDPKGAVAAAEELVRFAVDERVRQLKQGLDELREIRAGRDESDTEQLRTRLIRYEGYYEQIAEPTRH
jgi:hypothetical protein